MNPIPSQFEPDHLEKGIVLRLLLFEHMSKEFKEEKDMYEALAKHFQGKGYEVLKDKFWIRPHAKGKLRRIDILAYKWKNKRVHEEAIECKLMNPVEGVSTALPQVIDSATNFGRTWVATLPGETVNSLTQLERLGIGYIQVSPGKVSPVLHPEPEKLRLLDVDRYVAQVRPVLHVLLSFRDFSGKSGFLCGGFQDTPWAAESVKGKLQHNICIDWDNGTVVSGLNLEDKRTFERLMRNWSSADDESFAKILRQLPKEYSARVRQERKRPNKDKNLCGPMAPHKNSLAVAQELRKSVTKGMRDKYWGPHLWISRVVWDTLSALEPDDYHDQLRATRSELDSVFDFFKNKI